MHVWQQHVRRFLLAVTLHICLEFVAMLSSPSEFCLDMCRCIVLQVLVYVQEMR